MFEKLKHNIVFLSLFIVLDTSAQVMIHDNWNIEAKLYENIVIETIDSEVQKIKLSKELNLGSTKGELKPKEESKYRKLVERLRKKRQSAVKKESSLTWEERVLKNQQNWIQKKTAEEKRWIKDRKKVLEKWRSSKEEFNKKIPSLKKSLIPRSLLNKSLKSKEPTFGSANKVRILKNEISLISQSFHLPMKYQGERATCASFAAVRGIEIKLKPTQYNLSEQFFYYLSRPECQKKKCSQKGSWARLGMKSLNENKYLLPFEKDCPYEYQVKQNNITHIPLKKSCFEGQIKVNHYYRVDTTDSIKRAIESGHPVIVGFYVSDTFIKNDGLVRFNRNKSKKEFAHTVLAIGILPFSKTLHQSEGRFCLLVANSWGSGWGSGGYSCLSEKWVLNHKIENPSLVIERVSIVSKN